MPAAPFLNYHHLRYFWAVAREGSVTAAARLLNAAQPTVSAQVNELEAALGERLLERRGRGLALTEMGRVAFRYADEIVSLGRELLDTVAGRSGARTARLIVGVADAVPKIVAYRVLAPTRRLPEPVAVVCVEGKAEHLVAALATHDLDLVLADVPVPPGVRVKAFSHLLGETAVTFFGTAAHVRALRRGFPRSLDGAPLLLPTTGTALRHALDQWFAAVGVSPDVAGEFDDPALLKTFGEAGVGAFAGPSAIEREIRRRYGVGVIGRADAVKERFYAISVERRIRHPAVTAIVEAARERLFA